jgi:hypothetical protein
MKYLKYFEKYKNYNNININNPENGDFYYVPFSFFKDEICIKNENDWVLCLNNKFHYDYIKDQQIENSLTKNLDKINIDKDWTNYLDKDEIFSGDRPDKHVLRIAKLVKELKNNKPLKPVLMFFDDRYFQYGIPNFIEDGSHRIRALQFLNYDTFPAYIHGNYSKYLIKKIKEYE